jgi:hypothetical protein
MHVMALLFLTPYSGMYYFQFYTCLSNRLLIFNTFLKFSEFFLLDSQMRKREPPYMRVYTVTERVTEKAWATSGWWENNIKMDISKTARECGLIWLRITTSGKKPVTDLTVPQGEGMSQLSVTVNCASTIIWAWSSPAMPSNLWPDSELYS